MPGFSRAARLLLCGERAVLEELTQLAAELAPRLPDATRWDLQRMADAAGDGLLGSYLRKVAVELA